MKRPRSLTQAIDFYLSTRRSLGFALKPDEPILRSLARRVQQIHHRGPLTEKVVLDWARLPAQADPLWWARRLVVVRRFARFWQAFDRRVQVPPAGVFGPAYRRRPVHLYTAEEISRLFEAAAALIPARSLVPATFRTLLGLLVCTGLRISEALHLYRHDFDAAAGTLLIRKSKAGQSRCLPLKPSSVAALQRYQRRRPKHHPPPNGGTFFSTEKGRPLSYRIVSAAFRSLRQQLGWTQAPIPRLHDLRHTFAVNRLIAWQRRGHDQVGRKMLALATYLGHRNIRHTYWYLSAEPQLLALASQHLASSVARGGGR